MNRCLFHLHSPWGLNLSRSQLARCFDCCFWVLHASNYLLSRSAQEKNRCWHGSLKVGINKRHRRFLKTEPIKRERGQHRVYPSNTTSRQPTPSWLSGEHRTLHSDSTWIIGHVSESGMRSSLITPEKEIYSNAKLIKRRYRIRGEWKKSYVETKVKPTR
ncbi:hypothetical protein GALMADRAFT_912190 [Galerina marginata CBS 339.88]|uniref:Uncharacterized protein n=1 Tax=Galerina marginata (strain CBS 339.88) TaxID=685588 RepID=A0A067SIL2_GALM3|nr:hypothetical protein GALMADRAFT_912190 [Galerina marginata CBS 339.88]